MLLLLLVILIKESLVNTNITKISVYLGIFFLDTIIMNLTWKKHQPHSNGSDQIGFPIDECLSLKLNDMFNYVVERVSTISEMHNQYDLELDKLQQLKIFKS